MNCTISPRHLAIAALTLACALPPAVGHVHADLVDANLTVWIDEDVPIRADPSNPHVVHIDGYESANGLRVDNILVELTPTTSPDGRPGLILRSTSSTVNAGAMWRADTPVPVTSTFRVTADVAGLFPSGASTFATTTHLQGDYIKMDPLTGQRLPPGEIINYARTIFDTALFGVLPNQAVPSSVPQGQLDGGLVQGQPADVSFGPPDVHNTVVMEVASVESLITLELGAYDAMSPPVSATFSMVLVPEPGTLGLIAIGGIMLIAAGRRMAAPRKR